VGDTYTAGWPVQRELHDQIMVQADLREEEWLLRYLRPGARVLDIGCGPGSIDCQICSFVQPGGNVVGLDIDASTLQRAVAQGCANACFLQGSAYTLPFCNQAFDVVYCRHLLMHLADAGRALGEAIRVTRYDGHVIAREGDFDTWSYYPRYSNWEKLFDVVRRSVSAATIGRQLWSMFHQAGLADICIRGIVIVATGDAFRRHMVSWLQTFKSYDDYLIRSDACTNDELARAWAEAEELLREPFGFFSCLEYEVVGSVVLKCE
jgi:SAM-dependent methyltransferase